MANTNIDQITNIADTILSTDKMYIGRSPFDTSSDYVILGSSVLASFLQPANNLSDVATPATARTNLGLAIGTNVQAHSATLDAVTSGSYTGASSISTVGTISTGTWQGTLIAPGYGGTGVNNGSSTITLGGNLITSGANNLTLTTIGATNVTLPTGGTLLSSTTGTFTPSITASGTNPTSITYTNQIGSYAIIGNTVNIYVRITISALTLGIASGDLQIISLPLASVNVTNFTQVLPIITGNFTYTGTQLVASIDPNTAILNLSQSSTASSISKLAITALSATTDIIIEGYYFRS